MRQVYLQLFFLFLPLFVHSQTGDRVDEILRLTSESIENSGGVEITFSHEFFDEDDETVFTESGTLKFLNDKFMMDTKQMKVWCNGNTRWNYMVENQEIYVTEPVEDTPESFSPEMLFHLNENGYDCELVEDTETTETVEMTTTSQQDVTKIVLQVNKKTHLPESFVLYYADGHGSDIKINTFKKNVSFDDSTFVCNPSNYDAEVIDMR